MANDTDSTDELISTAKSEPRPTPPRVITVPPLPANVAPLPRHRSPNGTGLAPVPPVRAVAPAPPRAATIPPTRTATIPPARGATIPPARGTAKLSAVRPPPVPARTSAAMPAASDDDVPRASQPALPTDGAETVRASQPVLPSDGAETVRASQPVIRAAPPPLPGHARSPRTEAPANMPVAAPFEPTTPPLPAGSRLAPPASASPSVAPPAPADRSAASSWSSSPTPVDMTAHQAWFQPSEVVAKVDPRHEETWIGTLPVNRGIRWSAVARQIALPMALLVVVGALVGAYFAFDRQGGKPRAAAPSAKTAPAAPVAAAPTAAAGMAAPAAAAKTAAPATPAEAALATAPAPASPATSAAPSTDGSTARAATAAPSTDGSTARAAAAAETTAPSTDDGSTTRAAAPVAPSLVDVRIDSTPAGATVMLVDRGKTFLLGTTPLRSAVDPSRTYELEFHYGDQPSQRAPLDPTTTQRVAVALEVPRPAPRPRAAKVEAPPRIAPAPPRIAAVEPAGEGVLMISTKPPCEIHIDGKPTGLTTPQRSIALPAGSHRITLVNAAENIHKTVAVQIAAGQSTKLIQDLMK